MLTSKQLTPANQDSILRLHKNYEAAFDELAMVSASAEGKRRREVLVLGAASLWEATSEIIDLTKAGQYADGLRVYRQKYPSRYDEITGDLGNYLTYRGQQLSKIRENRAATVSHTRWILSGFALVWLMLSLAFGVMITRSIAYPLSDAIVHLNEVAGGDLTRDTPAEFQDRGDEIGLLSKAKQAMIVNLRQMVEEVSSGFQVLSSSSAELSVSSDNMSSGSRETSGKAHTVAAAAEQLTANVTSVAAGMEQTTTNLTNVSSSTEQMTSTIGEIAANSEKARRITEDARRQAVRISEQMNQLGHAASEIGRVTETITEISSQTNLLALNATIEAARAGAAGKGFAVVANEIKELAQQTANATEDIKTRINDVQASTTGGIAEIEKVSKVILDVSEIVSSIAAAIEEQSAVTKDIAQNIAEASLGVQDANKRVAEASQATNEIARDIVSVDHAAGVMSGDGEKVRSSATDLTRVAEQLHTTVARFRV